VLAEIKSITYLCKIDKKPVWSSAKHDQVSSDCLSSVCL